MTYIQKNSPLKQHIKGPWPDDTGEKLMKGIGKVGDFVKKNLTSNKAANFVKENAGNILMGMTAPFTAHKAGEAFGKFISGRNKSTGPKGPVDEPSTTLPLGKLPAGTTQKMGLMIKKLRKIPVPQSTTPELPKGTEKSTMGLFNPTPPKKSISELKVLQGVDLSKDKRDIVAINQNANTFPIPSPAPAGINYKKLRRESKKYDRKNKLNN